MLKEGYKTSEFGLIVVVAVFALLVVSGVLSPEKVQQASEKVDKTAEALPALIAAGERLIDRLGPLLTIAGLAWAYMRRRYSLKQSGLPPKEEVEAIANRLVSEKIGAIFRKHNIEQK